MKELDDAIYEQIREICAGGDALADGEFYEEALACYWKAWALLPPPAHDWDAATWILGAIGDAEFLRGDYAAARDALQDAVVYARTASAIPSCICVSVKRSMNWATANVPPTN